ncbi:MAG: AAA family ATPase, partial [Methanobrevibacter sp.]|nr:AAA family ATPase [Candidatus Methanovirga meridionalis]
MLRKLPIGTQSFSILRENNYLYIDKTRYIHQMIEEGRIYFLSRPRRFGKSLLISTIEELFKGNKELFKGLYIYDKWDWKEKYPVIRLDFGEISHDDPETLKKSLIEFIQEKAEEFDLILKKQFISSMFGELIKKISKKTNSKIVILIDEYDKAINNHLDDIELAKKNRDILRGFYQVLKANDQYLKFLFITGISKFAKTTIFSDLNHVDDITIHPRYSKICGYTQEDLENQFDEHINELSKRHEMKKEDLLISIKEWYNGYSWDGKNFLYNPFSILRFFDAGKIANYWADTGTPKLLVDILKTTEVDLNVLNKKKSEFIGSFPNFELDNMDFATVLLQTGYFTIKNEESRGIEPSLYTTGTPNKEVEESLFTYILGVYTNNSAESVEP